MVRYRDCLEYANASLVGVHDASVCGGRVCVLHSPTDHHMRDWVVVYREDRGFFERLCEHGVGHPDPDMLPFWKMLNLESEAVHGCDGCCT